MNINPSIDGLYVSEGSLDEVVGGVLSVRPAPAINPRRKQPVRWRNG